MRSRPLSAIWPALVLMLFAPLVVAQPTGDNPPAASQPAASQPALDPEVDKILTRLEERKVSDLRARLAWQLRYIQDLPEDDPKLRRPDITLARKLLSWEPTVARSDGVARMVEYFRQQLARV